MLGSQFNYIDQSQIEEIEEVVVTEASPIMLACFGAPKGTEDLFTMSGDEFVQMFGQPDHKAYGESSLIARRIIDAGGTIVGKRIVADDATLANTLVYAHLYVTRVQRTNAAGRNLYTDENGNETTNAADPTDPTATYAPIIDATAHVTYETQTLTGIRTVDQIKSALAAGTTTAYVPDYSGTPTATTDSSTGETTTTWPVLQTLTADGSGNERVQETIYPLFAVYDCGRGPSAKRFQIVPENKLSKNLSFMYYTLTIIEDGKEIDSTTFSMIPDLVINNECIDLNSRASTDLTLAGAYMDENNFTQFVNDLESVSDIDQQTLIENDPIFLTTRKGIKFATAKVEADSIDLTTTTGIELSSGDFGNFGPNPETDTVIPTGATMSPRDNYYQKILEFYNGTTTDDIYDVDSYQIDACFDPRYPKPIKRAIAELAEFRKDFMFFRNLNDPLNEVNDIESIRAARDDETNFPREWWITDYFQNYDVVDVYSKKQINVSIYYDIAPMMVNHIIEGREIPFAGQRNDAVISSIIKGTLNYKPHITPRVNEKDDLEDLRVNFGTYFGEDFVLEDLYTSQEPYTQLSFYNNVMALQEVIKVLRITFPAQRYAFIRSNEDIEEYTSQINAVLEGYTGAFSELEFSYTGNSKYIQNKIYKAMLTFRFGEFIQAEIIDAYALPSNIGGDDEE